MRGLRARIIVRSPHDPATSVFVRDLPVADTAEPIRGFAAGGLR
jgi:hypothetical protein